MLLAKDYLDMLKSYEETLAGLYEVFESRFWLKRKFWRQLAAEERRHVQMIIDMKARAEAGEGTLRLKGFVGVDVIEARNFVMNLMNRASDGGVGRREAVHRAADIEQTAIEGDFYGILEAEGAIKEILSTLKKQSREKRDRLDKELRRWF